MKMRLYYQENREKFYLYGKKHREENREKIRVYLKKYRKENPPDKKKASEYGKNYYHKNREKINARIKMNRWLHPEIQQNQKKKKLQNNLQYRLSLNLRRRLSLAIKGKFRGGSAVRDLGCSIPELITYLEKKFQSGMSWENWSMKGWHIDHIIPLNAFDLTKSSEIKKACHYTNLQPLWAKKNIAKSNKIK